MGRAAAEARLVADEALQKGVLFLIFDVSWQLSADLVAASLLARKGGEGSGARVEEV